MTDREFDVLIAKNIFGYAVEWQKVSGGEQEAYLRPESSDRGEYGTMEVPRYLYSDAAACTILDRMRHRGYFYSIGFHFDQYRQKTVIDCSFWQTWLPDPKHSVSAKDSAMGRRKAICLAALKACGVEVPTENSDA